jgi:hypothetical protein
MSEAATENTVGLVQHTCASIVKSTNHNSGIGTAKTFTAACFCHRWSRYNFPGEADSSPKRPEVDDSMMWIYENVDALFPSIYLESANATVNREVSPPRMCLHMHILLLLP